VGHHRHVAGGRGVHAGGRRLADLYGKQRVLVVNAALLVAGSVVVAMTSSLLPVLAGRALQGFAMGFIPVGISLMREFTPPHITGTAIAAMSDPRRGGAIGLPLAAWIATATTGT
jgi:MFS family permease